MKNLNRIILPIAIIASCIIIGGFYYLSQVNKQKSIEKQQLIDLEAKKEIENKKVELEKGKMEQDKKEYVADRKNDCLNIYKIEGDKWNNVKDWRYNEYDDECLMRYRSPNPKSDAECDDLYPADSGLSNFWEIMLCKDGEFEKSF